MHEICKNHAWRFHAKQNQGKHLHEEFMIFFVHKSIGPFSVHFFFMKTSWINVHAQLHETKWQTHELKKRNNEIIKKFLILIIKQLSNQNQAIEGLWRSSLP